MIFRHRILMKKQFSLHEAKDFSFLSVPLKIPALLFPFFSVPLFINFSFRALGLPEARKLCCRVLPNTFLPD